MQQQSQKQFPPPRPPPAFPHALMENNSRGGTPLGRPLPQVNLIYNFSDKIFRIRYLQNFKPTKKFFD